MTPPTTSQTLLSDPRIQRYGRVLPANEFGVLSEWLDSFFRFQRDWILETAKVALACKARQIGYSHSSAGKAVLKAVYHGETTTIISVGDRESKEVLDKCKRHANVLVRAGSHMARRVRSSASVLEFPSGGRIIALPASGGRSFTGHVILDEFAYHEHAAEVWDAAAAVALLGFTISIVSTPNGVGNDFANLWDELLAGRMPPSWVGHEVDVERAIADGYPVDKKECWAIAQNDPRIYDQLFRCKFLDNLLQYITSDLINMGTEALKAPWVEYSPQTLLLLAGAYEPDAKRRRFGGLDIGEKRDKTSLVILEEDKDDELHTIHIESHSRTDDEVIDSLAAKAFDFYGVQRLAGDETGIGTFPSKRIRRNYGSRFEPVTFSLKTKEAMCTAAYDLFSKKRIHVPREYPFGKVDEGALLRDDIAAIRREVTAAGNVRFDAQRTKKGHADRAWAHFLAIHAASRPKHDLTVYAGGGSR